ncbi:predicted protein [Nematostella vectensis]|uniref:C2H2-type domain-containing protein n=1 Tax=Nematostella vectensis TaxID=45351 RepID=A7SD24_NEMVE|nr:predicted protein [Nematostella vectensis]|eukprot:XP_001630479.1 predicted protein [Nematostella vectensis]
MECAVVFFMLVFATFHLKVACLSCIFCVSPSNPAACTDEFEIGCWSGMQCFWAVGRVWNGSETVIVYSKGFAPCHTRQIACNYINRTISDIWSKDAYLVDCICNAYPMSDKPTRIPLARSTGGSSAATKSSILINYGWAAEGGKQRRRKNAPDEESEEETRSQSSSSENVNQVSYQLPSDPVQLSLSQPQLNALSFNLSELADRISPSMHCELEEEDWEPRPRAGSWDHPSRHVDDLGNHVHSKVPYARMRENRSYVSRKKSFTKLRSTHVSSSKSQPVDDERKNAIAMTMPGKSFKGTNTSDVEKAAEYLVALKVDTSLGSTIVKQSSLESGYNSSMSISSISANDDLKDADTEAETDVDEAFKSEGESATDNASKYASLQKKISDVEQRINSLIQGKGNTEIPGKSVQDVKSTDKPTKEGLVNNQIISKPDSNLDVNQNKGENENDKDLKKSPFQLSKSGKGASDEPGARRGPRPGLVRRRTTLVSFRPPRQSPGFSETSNSEVFEMDEAAFVQYLTDVRAMKTMLLKLKRELQEADVASPLSHSLAPHSASTQACSTAGSTIASSSPSQSNGSYTSISNAYKITFAIDWSGIEFPVSLKQIDKFEKQNQYTVNVFGYETKIYPLRISEKDPDNAINLLLISDDETNHYCWIKNMMRLVSTQIDEFHHTRFLCCRCLNSFRCKQSLEKHSECCGNHEAVEIEMPKIDKDGNLPHIKFKNYNRKMRVPFVVYADFESFTENIDTCSPDGSKSFTKQYQKHKPSGFCYLIKCFDGDISPSELVRYTAESPDEDIPQLFVESLESDIKKIYDKFRFPKKNAIRWWLSIFRDDLKFFPNERPPWSAFGESFQNIWQSFHPNSGPIIANHFLSILMRKQPLRQCSIGAFDKSLCAVVPSLTSLDGNPLLFHNLRYLSHKFCPRVDNHRMRPFKFSGVYLFKPFSNSTRILGSQCFCIFISRGDINHDQRVTVGFSAYVIVGHKQQIGLVNLIRFIHSPMRSGDILWSWEIDLPQRLFFKPLLSLGFTDFSDTS